MHTDRRASAAASPTFFFASTRGGPGLRSTAAGLASMAALVLGTTLAAPALGATGPKYYFQLHEVQSTAPVDEELRRFTAEAVKAELAARPDWASTLDGVAGGDPDADTILAELKKRNLRGFDLVVKLAELRSESKDPSPGSRMKRAAVNVKLTVLGTTLPGNKMAFSGDGEAGAEAEVSERRMEAESQVLMKDCIKDALRQALDQAVLKLGAPQSALKKEPKRKRKK